MFVIANLLIFHVSILVNTANKQGFKGIGFRWSRLLLVGDYVGLYKLRDWNGVVGKYAVQVGLWVIEGLGDYYVTPSSLRILLKTFFSSENAETASKSPSDPLNTVFRLNWPQTTAYRWGVHHDKRDKSKNFFLP